MARAVFVVFLCALFAAAPVKRGLADYSAPGKPPSEKIVPFDETGEGAASKYEKPLDAQSRALDDALAKAAAICGAEVHYGFVDMETGSKKASSRIVAQYISNWTNAVMDYTVVGKPVFSSLADGSTKCVLRIAGRAVFRGRADPGYKIEFAPSGFAPGGVYFAGDEIKISFSATKDSYVSVIVVSADGAARLVYPNEYVVARPFKAGENICIPSAADSFRLVAALSPGKKESSEAIHLILTRDAPLFSAPEIKSLRPVSGASPVGDIASVSRRLAALDRARWTMMVAPYVVKSR